MFPTLNTYNMIFVTKFLKSNINYIYVSLICDKSVTTHNLAFFELLV